VPFKIEKTINETKEVLGPGGAASPVNQRKKFKVTALFTNPEKWIATRGKEVGLGEKPVFASERGREQLETTGINPYKTTGHLSQNFDGPRPNTNGAQRGKKEKGGRDTKKRGRWAPSGLNAYLAVSNKTMLKLRREREENRRGTGTKKKGFHKRFVANESLFPTNKIGRKNNVELKRKEFSGGIRKGIKKKKRGRKKGGLPRTSLIR